MIYRQIENDDVPCQKVIDFIWENLPKIAQRQIMHYINKMAWDEQFNHCRNKEMYVREINKVILHENNDMVMI